MIELAEQLDALRSGEKLVVTETASEVMLSDVPAEHARAIFDMVVELGWAIRAENAALEVVEGEFDKPFEPFRLTLTKPEAPGVARLLTLSGFDAWLRNPATGRVEAARAASPFETEMFSVSGWFSEVNFLQGANRKSPRTLARELGDARSVPDDIRPWLIRSDPIPHWNDTVYEAWRKAATLALLRSIATEVSAGSALLFSGNAKLWLIEPSADQLDLSESRFKNLQRLVHWVYESPTETETRFRLVNYELGRMGKSGRIQLSDVSEYFAVVVENARLAYQYNLAKVSSESTKALSDLRKSLSEETSKLTDMVRQVVTSVSGTLFVCIGLIAARMSTDTPPLALAIMAIVVVAYAFFVIWSGQQQIKSQRSIRMVWRARLYGYISDQDYQEMILKPAGEAEEQFDKAKWVGGSIAAIAALAAIAAAVF